MKRLKELWKFCNRGSEALPRFLVERVHLLLLVVRDGLALVGREVITLEDDASPGGPRQQILWWPRVGCSTVLDDGVVGFLFTHVSSKRFCASVLNHTYISFASLLP